MTTDKDDIPAIKSRIDEVMDRDAREDLAELRIDRQALEEQLVDDRRRLDETKAELQVLETKLAAITSSMLMTQRRLQGRIRAIADLEIEEAGK